MNGEQRNGDPADPPREILNLDIWVCYWVGCRECGKHTDPETKECPECGEKTTKIPIDATTPGERPARSNDPSTWTSYEEAVTRYREDDDVDGLGFMFSETPLAGVDLDGCVDPETGEIDEWALDIVDRLDSYTEYSPSGTGLHVIVEGSIEEDGNRRGGVEMYDSGRYFTFTGERMENTPETVNERHGPLNVVHTEYVYRERDEGVKERTEEVESELADGVDVDLDLDGVEDGGRFTNVHDTSLDEIRSRDEGLDRLLDYLDVPEYESTSEADMATASRLWYWGFDERSIAGIIRSHRRRGKVVDRDDYLSLTIAKAATGEQYRPDTGEIDAILDETLGEPLGNEWKYLDDRYEFLFSSIATLNESAFDLSEYLAGGGDADRVVFERRIEDFDDRSVVLIKSPRSGGSHVLIYHEVERDDGISFYTTAPKHEILGAGVEKAVKAAEEAKRACTAVHVEGVSRVCECGGELHPDHDQRSRATADVRDMVVEARVTNTPLTAETIRDREWCEQWCTAWVLKEATRHADAVFTPPQLLSELVRDFPRDDRHAPDKRDRDGVHSSFGSTRLVIDEEQAIDEFRVPSAPLLTLTATRDNDGSIGVTTAETPIRKLTSAVGDGISPVDAIRADVEAMIEEREEDPETEYTQSVSWQTDILNLLDDVEELAEITSGLGAADVSDANDVLERRLDDFEFTTITSDPTQLKRHVDELCQQFYSEDDDERDPSDLLLALAFPYRENPFHWKADGNGRYKWRVVGDFEIVFEREVLGAFDTIRAIAGPEGERVIGAVDETAVAVELTEFPFAHKFLVAPVCRQRRTDDDELVDESAKSQRRRVARISRRLNRDHTHPHIAFTGTSDEAYDHVSTLSDHATVVSDPVDPMQLMYDLHTSGATAGIYAGSKPARGIDVPVFDVTAILSTGFAVPGREAQIEHLEDALLDVDKEEDPDTFVEIAERLRVARSIRDEINAREVTNGAFRMSPTVGTADVVGTKLILVAKADLDSVRYVDDRVLPRIATARTGANMARLLTARGGASVTSREFADIFDGDSTGYWRAVITEALVESEVPRPDHEIEEVEAWIEGKAFTGTIAERVIDAVDRLDRPTTNGVIESLKRDSRGRVSAILSVLDRRGVLHGERVETDGAPATVWEVRDKRILE